MRGLVSRGKSWGGPSSTTRCYGRSTNAWHCPLLTICTCCSTLRTGSLRKERRERLAAPLDGRWVCLAVNQRTPYSLHLPSATDRRFPPISRHDLAALIVVANPTRPESWRLPAFDATAIVAETRKALGSIPSDTLCEGVERALGPSHP